MDSDLKCTDDVTWARRLGSKPASRPRLVASPAGQAMVESAIILPMYVFLMLGLLQLGLMHQAQTLTKYAAYKAARAGALNNARVSEMERAAAAVLLPLASRQSGGVERIAPVDGVGAYAAKWALFSFNRMPEPPFMKLAKVTICGPVKGDLPRGAKEVEFDDPKVASGTGWTTQNRTKLRIQVTFNYRMPIPFANAIIHAMWLGQEVSASLRLGKRELSRLASHAGKYAPYLAAARMGDFVIPIRAEYSMRMQSNIYVNEAPIPDRNDCVIPFDKK